ncbi:MAG: hypothetical protein EP330_09360 [Deltaproteobacteria bacterium]|nr:MAG: hypothetical protein EP330_09360 [Deltaproteobacteria bacterium]
MLLLLTLLALAATPEDVPIRGADSLPSAARTAAVEAGDPDPEAVLQRLLVAYEAAGFPAARGWVVREEGREVLEIDEGRIDRVALMGASPYRQLLLSDNVQLAGEVLRRDRLESSLASLEAVAEVRKVSWELAEGRDLVPLASGRLVPERVLQVALTTEVDRGLDVDFSVDPTWGFLAGARYDTPIAGESDHLETSALIAFPLQEYVFEQEPQLRWVHGVLEVGYRTPSLPRTQLAPRISDRLALSNYSRPYDGLLQGGVLHNAVEISLDLRAGPLIAQVGPTFEAARVAFIQMEEGAEPLGEAEPVTRMGLFVRTEWAFADRTLRADLRDALALDLTGQLTGRGLPHWRGTLRGQAVGHLGRSLVIARGRAFYRGGDVRFFDDEPIAGRWQRVYFQGRYWSRRGAQAELGLRLPLSRDVKLGVFHDVSAFEDASTELPVVINAAGPSLHVLVAGQFALDLHYGFGARPGGWSHNLSIGLTSAY